METVPIASPLDPWFVTGFVEGEGSFTFSRTPTGFTLVFAIKRLERGSTVLERIQAFFGAAGKIYRVAPGAEREARYYRVTRAAELRRVIDHFDRYPLRGRKAEAYGIWRQMYFLKLVSGEGECPAELEALARRLSARRRSARVATRTTAPDPGAGGTAPVGADARPRES